MTALNVVELNARLATLYKMRDNGVLIIRHGDTSTQMRSLDELLRTITILEGQLNGVTGNPRRSRVSYIRQSSKGYGDVPNGDDTN